MYKSIMPITRRQPNIPRNGAKDKMGDSQKTQMANKGMRSKHHHEVLFCAPQIGKN